jgi:hypothetical protein
MQVFTRHAETTPLALMLNDNVPVNAPLDFIKTQKLMKVVKLSMSMTEIQSQKAEKAALDRKAAIQKHKDKTHVRPPNFQVGYYVLVAEQRKSVCPSCRSSGRARAATRVWISTSIRRGKSIHEGV